MHIQLVMIRDRCIEQEIKTYKKHRHSKRLANAVEWLEKPKIQKKEEEIRKLLKKPIQKKPHETYKERKRRNQKAYSIR